MSDPNRSFFHFSDASGAGVEVCRYQREDLLLTAVNPDPTQYSPVALEAARSIIDVRRRQLPAERPEGAEAVARTIINEGGEVYIAKTLGLDEENVPLAYGRVQTFTPTSISFTDLETTRPTMGTDRCRAATAAIVAKALLMHPEHELVFAHTRAKGPETRSYTFFAQHLGMVATMGPASWGQPGAKMFGRRSEMLKIIEATYLWDMDSF